MRIYGRLPFTGERIEIHFPAINLIPTALMVMLPLIPADDSLYAPLQSLWSVWQEWLRFLGGLSFEAIGGMACLILLLDWYAARRFRQC